MLFHIHSDVQQRESTLSELQESFDEHRAIVARNEGELKRAKKEASTARSAFASKEKTRIKLEGEVDELQPSAIESSEAITALGKRVASDGNAVTRIEREREAHASKLAELEG